MEVIPDRLSVHTITQICILIFISDSNHNATISKVIRYTGQSKKACSSVSIVNFEYVNAG